MVSSVWMIFYIVSWMITCYKICCFNIRIKPGRYLFIPFIILCNVRINISICIYISIYIFITVWRKNYVGIIINMSCSRSSFWFPCSPKTISRTSSDSNWRPTIFSCEFIILYVVCLININRFSEIQFPLLFGTPTNEDCLM